MEKTKCYMWLENKHIHHPCTKPMKKSNHETYLLRKNHQEEVAFIDKVAARGTTNIEGGCGSIWPPRSYACSFCKREFKSAQALGGHMNVHRRDRALLKQITINNPNKINNNNNNNNNNINTRNNNKNNSIFPTLQLKSLNKHSKSMLAKNKPSHLNTPRKSFASHISTPSISSKISQSSHKFYDGSAKKVDQHVRDGNLRGERNDDYLYKRSKKNDGYVALLPSFLGETIKRSSVWNDGLQVPEILALNGSKSMDDLDLELRLGNSSQKV